MLKYCDEADKNLKYSIQKAQTRALRLRQKLNPVLVLRTGPIQERKIKSKFHLQAQHKPQLFEKYLRFS